MQRSRKIIAAKNEGDQIHIRHVCFSHETNNYILHYFVLVRLVQTHRRSLCIAQ